MSRVAPVSWRRGTLADAATIAAFGARVFAETFGADNNPDDLAAYLSSAYAESLQREELLDASVEYLLAETDAGVLAAFAMLRIETGEPSVQGAHPLQIERFYVDAPFHGTGLAAQLMARCLERATAHGADVVWLGVWERNVRAIRFYEKHGFMVVGRQIFHVGSDPQNDLVLARRIGH